MTGRRSALPARRTRLIGREPEIQAIRDRVLHGDRRLVTLTGAAGTGKTTLALETARALEPLLPDGAWFVDLTAVREPDAVVLAWCAVLGILDQGRPPIEALADHLAARQVLIVLDNCEHLLPALAGTVDRLLDACLDLRILATSRSPLRVRGESVHAVPPIEVPPPDAADDLARLARVESVQLFVERAMAADRSFALTSSTGAAVASICRRLDGIPLAIELAAANASVLSAVEIDERLATSGGLGGTTSADGPNGSDRTVGDGQDRQRTMEATLGWSHDLLRPAAQALFRRLAVFSGGWTLDAAEQVGSLGEDRASVVPLLATLVDHSMVVREGVGSRSRYRMLAPIAEYARSRLAASGELGPASMAHARYYLELTMSASATIGSNVPEDVDRVIEEHENLLVAVRFAEVAGILPLRLGLLRNLLVFWRIRGHLRWGVRELEAALPEVPEGSFEQGLLLGVLAEFAQLLGEYELSDERAKKAEAIVAAIGDVVGQRTAIGLQGLAAAGRGDLEGALAEYDRARPLVDAVPSDLGYAFWHAGVGRFKLAQGDLVAARHHLELANEHFGRAPSAYHGRVLNQLGVVARLTGDLDRATSLLRQAIELLRRYGATLEIILCLEDIARLEVERRAPRRAATLLAAAARLRDATGAKPPVPDRAELNREIERIRSMLPAREFDAAWSRGLDLDVEAAAALATAAPEGDEAVSPPRGSALTPREREIAELVALGLSNREIGERLVISGGTVKIHVERILSKLGRTSRVQIATWAMEEREAGLAEPAGR